MPGVVVHWGPSLGTGYSINIEFRVVTDLGVRQGNDLGCGGEHSVRLLGSYSG
jgi:hypothetical protein